MNLHPRLARLGAAGLAVAGLLAAAAPADAFRMIQNNTVGRVTAGAQVTCTDPGGFAHWTIRNLGWWHNTAGQGATMAAALTAAMTSWNNVTDADYVLTYSGTTAAGWATDGQNTALWAVGNGCGAGCLALTALVLQNGQVIVESDVTFNANETWSTNGTNRDTQSVATHEFGHSLGIHHTELTGTPRPTMFATYEGTAMRTLEADDRSALQCSENRYCIHYKLTGEGVALGGHRAMLYWNSACVPTANVDVFRDGVKVVTTPDDGFHMDLAPGLPASANYWVCEAGSTTWYDPDTCTNVLTISW